MKSFRGYFNNKNPVMDDSLPFIMGRDMFVSSNKKIGDILEDTNFTVISKETANDFPIIMEHHIGTGVTELYLLNEDSKNAILLKGNKSKIENLFFTREIEEEIEEVEEPEVVTEKEVIIKEIIQIPEIVHGEPGPEGDQGLPGIQGSRGSRGEQGEQGSSGLKGDKGEPGEDGTDGKDGKDGEQGSSGLKGDKGEPGEDGKDGIDGRDGKRGTAGTKGIKGDKGDRGNSGKDGKDGIDGKDGKHGSQGKQGTKGTRGEPGPKGNIGSKGDKGDGGESSIIRARFPLRIDKDQYVSFDQKALDSILQSGSGKQGPDYAAVNDWLAAAGGAVGIQDEGNQLIKSVSDVNFVGKAIKATRKGKNVEVTLPYVPKLVILDEDPVHSSTDYELEDGDFWYRTFGIAVVSGNPRVGLYIRYEGLWVQI